MDYYVSKPSHRIIVTCRYINQASKTFSIDLKGDNMKLVFQQLYDFVKNDLDDILVHKINFTNQYRKKKSHTIILQDVIRNKSHAVSINKPEYSSEEIAKEISKFLCNGRCCF